jgi:transcriptional repressor NF-X1
VVVFKGAKFVSAPAKTLALCVKIRAKQAAEAAAAAAASRPPSPPVIVQEPFNAYLLTGPRFGLTGEELTTALAADLATQPALKFAIDFLPASDEVVMRASASYSAFLSPMAMEQTLTSLKTRLATTIRQRELAGNILLCAIDDDGQVSRRENLSRQDASGWSAVAGRAASRVASPKPDEAPARGTGKKLLGLRKKKPEKSSWAALGGDVEC